MSASYKNLFTILLFLCIFLDLPLKSNESSNNLRKNSNFLRQLEGEQKDPTDPAPSVDISTFFSLSLTVINETITCDDNTIILPLFNPNSELNFSETNISLKVDGAAESFKPISCSPKNGEIVLGLNITEVCKNGKCQASQNISVTINFEQNTSDFSSLFENISLIKEVKFGNLTKAFEVNSFNRMFANCSSLEFVDFGNYTFEKVYNFSFLFDGCLNLTNVTFSSEVNITDAINLDGMFNGCELLSEVNLSPFTFENVTNMSNLFNGCKKLLNVSFGENIKSDNIIDIDGMFEGCELIEKPKIENFNFSKVERMNRLFKGCKALKDVEFNPKVDIQVVKNLSFAFDGCENLTQVNLTPFTFENVENMTNLFSGSKNLLNVTFGKNISSNNLIDIDGMFEGCELIKSIDLTIFNFSKVEKMDRFFKGCKELDRIEFNPEINIQVVKNLSFAFDGCENLTEVNLSLFTFENVTDMTNLFNGSINLVNVTFGKNITSEKLISIDGMFEGCEKLISIDLTLFDFSKVEKMDRFLRGCRGLHKIEFNPEINIQVVKNLSFAFDGCENLTEVNLSLFTFENVTDMTNLFNGSINLVNVTLGKNITSEKLISIDGMFEGCEKLISVDLTAFNFSNVEKMDRFLKGCKGLNKIDFNPEINIKVVKNLSFAFDGCENLTQVNLTPFTFENVENMSNLFNGAKNLTDVTFGKNITSGKLVSVDGMFEGCELIKSIDLTIFNFSKVEKMDRFFKGCRGLHKIEFNPNVDIQVVKNLSFAFDGCGNLTQVNLTPFTFENVENISNLFNGSKSLVNVTFGKNITSHNLIDINGMFEGCEGIKSIDLTIFNFSNVKRMNRLFKGCKELDKIEFKLDIKIEKVEDLSFAFDGCENLKQINLNPFTFENVENMSNLFNGSKNLLNVTFGDSITSKNLTSVDSMFEGCEKLNSVNLTVFNFSKVTRMDRFFKGCKVLDKIEFNPIIDIKDIKDFSFAFDGCENLKKVNLTPFTFENVENMSNLFNGSKNLLNVTFGKNITSEKLISVDGMFEGCELIKSIDLTIFNFSKVEKMDRFFKGCRGLHKIEFNPEINIQVVKNLSFAFDGCENLTQVNLTPFTFENVEYMTNLFNGSKNLTDVTFGKNITSNNLIDINGMFEGCEVIKSIDLTIFNFSKVEKMDRFFRGCRGLHKIEFNPNVDIKIVKNLSFAFDGCGNLTQVNLTPFTFENVENMTNLFNGSKSLVNITFGKNIKSHNLIDINGMFEGCEGIKSIDLTIFNFSNVKRMDRFFRGCKKLDRIEFNLDIKIEKVEDLSFAFDGCENLKDINLSLFTFENVENMSNLFNGSKKLTDITFGKNITSEKLISVDGMFEGCEGIKSIDLTIFNFSKVEKMDRFFKGCRGLHKIEFNPEINIQVVKNLSFAFDGCENLTQVNLTPFTFENVENMTNLFNGSKSLVNVTFGKNITSKKLFSIDGMFEGCEKLISVDLTAFNFSNVEKMDRFFKGCRGLHKIEFNPIIDIKVVKNLSFAFDGCESLTQVNLTSFTFEKVENMSYLFNGSKELTDVHFRREINSEYLTDINGMFEGCVSIIEPKIQYFNFKKVKKMNRLFKGCKKLRRIEFNPQIKIEVINDLSFIFDGCEELNFANLSTFEFDHVENMSNLFNNCTSLSNLTLPQKINASSVTSIEYMFAGCANLVEFDLSIFTFKKLKFASNVFHGAERLKTVKFGRELDFTSCTSISFMFSGCTSLTTIDLSGVKTSELLIDFNSAFSGCTSLESVNLSGFKFSENCSMNGMFIGCEKITNINLSNCTISGEISFDVMFAGLNILSLNITIEGAIVSKRLLNYLKEKGVTIIGKPENVIDDEDDKTESSNSTSFDNTTSSNSSNVSSSSGNDTSSSSNISSNESSVNNVTIIEKKSSAGISGGATAGIVVATVAVVVAVTVATVVSVTASTTAATAGGVAVATGVGATVASSQAGVAAGLSAGSAAVL